MQKNLDLKICDLKAWAISFPVSKKNSVRLGVGQALKRDAVVVKVTTDSGLYGWGSLIMAERRPQLPISLIMHYDPLLWERRPLMSLVFGRIFIQSN